MGPFCLLTSPLMDDPTSYPPILIGAFGLTPSGPIVEGRLPC